MHLNCFTPKPIKRRLWLSVSMVYDLSRLLYLCATGDQSESHRKKQPVWFKHWTEWIWWNIHLESCHSIPGPRHPSGSAGCVSEAAPPAAHTVEVSSAAPGEDARWSWGLYSAELILNKFPTHLSHFPSVFLSLTVVYPGSIRPAPGCQREALTAPCFMRWRAWLCCSSARVRSAPGSWRSAF